MANFVRIPFQSIPRMLARAVTAFYALPFLMMILVAGTLSQQWLGLYQAQQIFFNSAFIWIGPIPIPGTPCILAIMLLALTLKFIFHSQWRWVNAGIHLAHLGVLILLYGAVATAMLSQEGTLTLRRGQQQNSITDFHDRRMEIYSGKMRLISIPMQSLKPDKKIQSPDLPFEITILQSCRDCVITESRPPVPNAHGMARAVKLSDQNSREPDEAKIYGIRFQITGTNSAQDGEYISLDVMPRPVVLRVKQKEYHITFQKISRPLPFSVRLDDFERSYYPGTDKAKSYQSRVTISDGDMEWPAHIEMNEPLRYRGHTIFQSSFVDAPDGTASVFTVVKNDAWLFPYFGTVLLAIGLLWHAAVRVRK